MTKIRRKGVALVDTPKGILVVAGRRKVFTLPGGGADNGESRKHAAMRELREETGLKDKERWGEIQEKMVDAMIRLEKATKNQILQLE
jgi:ADP-ribose pyrophosphatase YjhB (NUDIX family)